MEIVKIDELLCAMILRSNFQFSGIKFFTEPNDSLQLGYMQRPKDYNISPHFHNVAPRNVEYTHEVLFIKSGRVKVNFYDKRRIYRSSQILESGDIILLMMGGHGFEMLEESEIVEVKQGPYIGELDKTRFFPNETGAKQ